jgi:hypothetical protein
MRASPESLFIILGVSIVHLILSKQRASLALVCVSVCAAPIVASQRLLNSSPIVAWQQLSKQITEPINTQTALESCWTRRFVCDLCRIKDCRLVLPKIYFISFFHLSGTSALLHMSRFVPWQCSLFWR